jgi:phosphoribosylaminoimidazole carboxylase (NCAIR synthetase)
MTKTGIKSNYDYIRIIQAKGQHIHHYGHIDHKTGRQIVIVNMLTLKTKKTPERLKRLLKCCTSQ